MRGCTWRGCLPSPVQGPVPLAITADLYTHVNRGLGKAAAEQITRALSARQSDSSYRIPATEPRKRFTGGW